MTWLSCGTDPTPDTCPSDQQVPGPIDMTGQNSDTTAGHGSHVAGIIAGDGTASGGLYTGVAPGAKLDTVSVGDGANILWPLDGFDYMLAHAAADNLVAISNSWGPSRAGATSDSAPATGALATAVSTALSQGISVLFAAGNDGVDASGIRMNHWVRDTSVLIHTAPAPAASPDLRAAAWLVTLGVLAAVAGTVGFRRRDLAGP